MIYIRNELEQNTKCGRDTIRELLETHEIKIQDHRDFRNNYYKNFLITNLKDYTVLNIETKRVSLKHNRCSYEFAAHEQTISSYVRNNNEKYLCPSCFKRIGPSREEQDIIEFLEPLYKGYLDLRNRDLLKRKEIDIVMHSLNLAIEYCGLYYHSEAMGKTIKYHQRKTKTVLKQGYRLITIFSDEWYNKKELVKDKLKR